MPSFNLTSLLTDTIYKARVSANGDGVIYADSNTSDEIDFKTLTNEEQEMADTFGAVGSGRVQQDGRFYAIPASNLEANSIYMPAYSTSPFFGINEVPITAGTLGAFATTGIFAFDFPNGWTSAAGKAVYWTPTSATAGSLGATAASGAVRIGYEVIQPNITGKLCVYLAPGNALESGT